MTTDANNRDDHYPHTEIEGPMPEAVTVHQPQQSKPPKGVTVWLAIAPIRGQDNKLWHPSLGFDTRERAENSDIGLRRDAVIVEVRL